MNRMNINIRKLTVKLIIVKKAKFKPVIELDTMITYTEAPRL